MGVGDAPLGRTRVAAVGVGGRGSVVGADWPGRLRLAGARRCPAASAVAARCRRGAAVDADVYGRGHLRLGWLSP